MRASTQGLFVSALMLSLSGGAYGQGAGGGAGGGGTGGGGGTAGGNGARQGGTGMETRMQAALPAYRPERQVLGDGNNIRQLSEANEEGREGFACISERA